MTDFRIREGDSDDFVAAMRLFEGALLDVNPAAVRDRLGDGEGDVLVASIDGRIVGAIALDPGADSVRVDAIAVRPSRRSAGAGRALIEAAADRAAPAPLSAEFDERVRGFYEACGFEVERREGRLRGRLPTE